MEVVYCAACEADSFLVEVARGRRGAGAARVMIATNDTDVQARPRGRCCECWDEAASRLCRVWVSARAASESRSALAACVCRGSCGAAAYLSSHAGDVVEVHSA